MNCLVTGAAGFIGSNFCQYMVHKYPKDFFVGLDALTYAGNYESIIKLDDKDNFMFIQADIRDQSVIENLFVKYEFDYVINFAAESHVDRSIISANDFLTTNIIGTHILMEASIKTHVKRFHQVSTDEVYGDLPLNKPVLKFTESTPIHTSSPYSASKASADLLVNAYHRTHGLPTTISRCSNNYGPYQYPEKLIPVMIQNALNNEKLPVYGKGLNIRDWLYVEDHCIAIDLIVKNGTVGEIYNIGGNTELKNIDLVHKILDILEKPKSLISYVEDRKGHDLRYAIDYSKINYELGWEPKYNFHDALYETIKWYKDNQDWVKKVIKKATQV